MRKDKREYIVIGRNAETFGSICIQLDVHAGARTRFVDNNNLSNICYYHNTIIYICVVHTRIVNDMIIMAVIIILIYMYYRLKYYMCRIYVFTYFTSAIACVLRANLVNGGDGYNTIIRLL